jgi:hypothetical protein
MSNIDKLNYGEVMKIAHIMGYDSKEPTELNKFIVQISKMDLWDIARMLFFETHEGLDVHQ